MYLENFTHGWKRPKSNLENFLTSHEQAVNEFKDNKVFGMLDVGEFTLKHYHSLLKAIFHQVYFSSSSFAIAGGTIAHTSPSARDYLLHHAEEEMTHWQWILEDLKSTGFDGVDPREEHPNWATQAYFAYGLYLAHYKPMARLAMAMVLEGISGKFGPQFGEKLVQVLKIKKENAKFFVMHGELDQGHTADIRSLLQKENLSPEEWSEMEHVARTTSVLYKNIYNVSMTP